MLCVPQRAITFGCLTSAVALVSMIQPAVAQSQFSDVQNSWAQPFIEGLAQRNVINGFPDGSFRPNQSVTRAEFAAIVRQAFAVNQVQPSQSFQDVTPGFWAASAIDHASATGFLSGYTDGTFQPNQPIPKVQALVAIANGLQLQPVGPVDNTLLRYYDAAQIPNYAKPGVAAATQRNIPVNYPNVAILTPNQTATRADIAAYVYQALVSQGRFTPIGNNVPAAQYVVQGGSLPATPTAATGLGTLPFGTEIPVAISETDKTANLVMTVGENVETTLVVANDVVSDSQQVVIPQGSRLVGRFQPFDVKKTEGTQFTANTLLIGNTPYSINASSQPIAARKKSSLKLSDLTGSVTTLAASALLDRAISGEIRPSSLVPGIIQTGQTLGQQVIGKSKTSDKVILVEPDQLGLKLNSEFAFLPGTSPTLANPTAVNLYQVNAGTQVALATQTQNARYVTVPGETFDVELTTGRPIYNGQNQVLVPAGSVVRGQLVPVTINGDEGAQFVARELMIGTQTYPITAVTNGVTSTSMSALSAADLQGNVIATADASQVLRGVDTAETTRPSTGGFLGLGNVLGGGRSGKRVVLVNPNSLLLEFRAPLSLENGAGVTAGN